ncbi:MAG: carbohydrate kinase, partial [Bacteroidales bacterium]|nr:carbohydrate kinase [Bacteroidales bacterium]
MIIGIGETVLDIVFKCGQPKSAVPGGSTFNAMVS